MKKLTNEEIMDLIHRYDALKEEGYRSSVIYKKLGISRQWFYELKQRIKH